MNAIKLKVKEEKNTLKLFNEKAAKLKKYSFTHTVFEQKTGISLSGKIGEPAKIERRGPDEEAIDAFILTLRFFIQDNEKTSFRNMAKTYENLPISKQNKALFANARKDLNNFLDSRTMFKINEQYLTNRQILYVFIYGGLSHANDKKKKVFDSWRTNPLLFPFLVNQFVCILTTLFNFISYIQNLNENVINELKVS